MFCNTCRSTLLTHFLETAVLQKKTCRLPPTYKIELGVSWFSINHRNIDNHISYEKVSYLKWVLKLTDVIQLTHDAIAAVTKDDWVSSCRHVEEVERKYWDADIPVEEEMEKIVI